MKKDLVNEKVTIQRIRASKDDWFVLCADTEDGEELVLTGNFARTPEINDVYEVTGTLVKSKYGEQYKVTEAKSLLPSSVAGIISYLTSKHIKGIGESLAMILVEEYGTDTLRVIHEEPERLLEIKGIGKKKLAQIKKSAEENRKAEEIYNITNGVITQLQVQKLLKVYGNQTVNKLKENPYETCSIIDGIGFLKADKIALGCGIARTSSARLRAAITYLLNDVIAANGHCYATTGQVEDEALNLLLPFPVRQNTGAEGKKLRKAVMNAESDETFAYLEQDFRLTSEESKAIYHWLYERKIYLAALVDTLVEMNEDKEVIIDNTRDRISSAMMYNAEYAVSEMVKEHLFSLKQNSNDSFEEASEFVKEKEKCGTNYNEDQKTAFYRALSNHISIVTGGPGCGKTTAIALLAEFWRRKGRSVFMMAPTGRAAQRIKESLGEQLPDMEFDTSTISMAVMQAASVKTDEETGRTTKEIESLAKDSNKEVLVICDETSMVDILLANSFLKLTKECRVVLVGDADQLPPVGAGNFFRDLISSGMITVTRLTKNYRSTGNIIANSQRIRAGSIELTTGPDFNICNLSKEEIPEAIVKQYQAFLAEPDTTMADICILTPQRKRGVACVKKLNELIQATCNPKADGKPEYQMQDFVFRLGDRVIHIKNNYRMIRTDEAGKEAFGVFNGDLGTIIAFRSEEEDQSVAQKELLLDGWNDDETGTEEEEENEEPWLLKVRFDDGSVAEYTETDLLQLELAYTMTVHKSQGSEFKYVIGTFAMDQYTMLLRAIIYTAETRAKKRFCMIGEKRAFQLAIKNPGNSKRNTYLPEFLLA